MGHVLEGSRGIVDIHSLFMLVTVGYNMGKSAYCEEEVWKDSGTASTTLCSSSTSSSPSPTMLTHGGSHLPLPRVPPTPQTHLPPFHPNPTSQNHQILLHPQDYNHRHPGELSLNENSYAEIPYGSLPPNNLNSDFEIAQQNNSPNSRNDWQKTNNFMNLNLGLEYPLSRPSQQCQGNDGYREQEPLPNSRLASGTSIVHLRDGPDGLHRIPEPRMVGQGAPSPDFRGQKGQTAEKKSKKCKRRLMIVIFMALSGIIYLALGGLAGFYYGQSECEKRHSNAIPVEQSTSSTTLLYTTASINATTTTTETTHTTNSPTSSSPTTTQMVPTTSAIPNYCQKVGNVCSCGPFGGVSGSTFSDRDDYYQHGNITGFTVKHNEYFISGLQIQYGGQQGAEHGYTEGGYRVNVQLLKDEYITAIDVDVTLGKGYVSRLLVQSNKRLLGPYGGHGGAGYSIKGAKLLYIEGRAGPLIDEIGFVFDRCS